MIEIFRTFLVREVENFAYERVFKLFETENVFKPAIHVLQETKKITLMLSVIN